MESLAETLDFARPRQSSTGRSDEFHFANMEEVLAFVAGEIVSSRRKYVHIARAAHVCPATVSALAHHATKAPRAATVFSILAALGFEVVVRR